MAWVPKPRAEARVPKFHLVTGEGAFGKSWSNVEAFITTTSMPDGAGREPGMVMLFMNEGRVKAMISDKELQQVAFVTGESVDAVLAALDDGLETDSLDWRPDRGAPTRRGK